MVTRYLQWTTICSWLGFALVGGLLGFAGCANKPSSSAVNAIPPKQEVGVAAPQLYVVPQPVVVDPGEDQPLPIYQKLGLGEQQ